MKEQILNVINELMQLTESGKYKVAFDYGTAGNWFIINIYSIEKMPIERPIFSDAISVNLKKWYSQWLKDKHVISEPFDLSPFIHYLQQLRTEKCPNFQFDPTESVTDDTQVL